MDVKEQTGVGIFRPTQSVHDHRNDLHVDGANDRPPDSPCDLRAELAHDHNSVRGHDSVHVPYTDDLGYTSLDSPLIHLFGVHRCDPHEDDEDVHREDSQHDLRV